MVDFEQIFFFNQVQTPVTLCSGELWSILVVRLAHSANLRSRLHHVSSAPNVACSTGCSWMVTQHSTNPHSTVLDFGDLTGTGMSPPLGLRYCERPGSGFSRTSHACHDTSSIV